MSKIRRLGILKIVFLGLIIIGLAYIIFGTNLPLLAFIVLTTLFACHQLYVIYVTKTKKVDFNEYSIKDIVLKVLWPKIGKKLIWSLILMLLVKWMIPDNTDKLIKILIERGEEKTEAEAYLSKLLGKDYREVLSNEETFESLEKLLKERDIYDLLKEAEYVKNKLVHEIKPEFMDRIIFLQRTFRFKAAREELDDYIKGHPNLPSKELARLHFIKTIFYIMEGKLENAEDAAGTSIDMTSDLTTKGFIVSAVMELGQPKIAYNLLKRTLRGLDETKVKDDPSWGGLLFALSGVASQAGGNTKLGISLAEKSLFYNLKNYGESHPNIMHTYSMLALNYGIDDNIKESNRNLHLALDLNERLYPDDLNSMGMIYLSLGENLISEGKFDEALEILKKSKRFIEKTSSVDRHTLYGLNMALASTYDRKMFLDSAKICYQNAFQYLNKKDKYTLGRYYGNYANHLKRAKDPEGAAIRYQMSLNLLKSILPADHPDVKHALYNLNTLKRID